MHKKILRILSLALAILLLVCVLPQKSSANDLQIKEIRNQITSTYKTAKRRSGYSTFKGHCASLVNWQMYLLGITTEKISSNGNQEYDYFVKRAQTSGGYTVRAYPASRYNMKEALNAASENGTRDAFNMIVCFQSTTSALGRLYGHALFVHAIIDGIVYYSENTGVTVGGTYYPEGSAIAVTIDEFCRYYERWIYYEGLIFFGSKTYADECPNYSSNLYAGLTEETAMYSEPCTTEVDPRSLYRYQLPAGERVHVVGLYENAEGEYWYQLNGSHEGFIPADAAQVLALDYSDVVAVDIESPSNLRAGTRFSLKGNIASTHNRIYTVRAQIYDLTGEESNQLYSVTAMVDGLDYDLRNSTLSNKLLFRKLSAGTYLYSLAAIVGNYYYANGAVQLEWKTVQLWSSQFNVVTSRGDSLNVSFIGNGGSTTLDRMELAADSSISRLPSALRPGYTFIGWFTRPVVGEQVTELTEFSQNTTLYAHWALDTQTDGWLLDGSTWRFVQDGTTQEGFVETDGRTYYVDANGVPVTGWKEMDNKNYYFNPLGIMQTGRISVDGTSFLLGEDGAALVGWGTIDNSTYFLNQDGSFYTGLLDLDGSSYLFDTITGALVDGD